MSKLKLIASLLGGIVFLIIVALFIYERGRANTLQEKYKNAQSQVKTLADENEQQKAKIDSFASLSQQHAEEMTNARNKIDDLESDLADKSKRLRINAVCPKLPKTDTTGSVGHAATARLTDAAQQNYLRLRRRITEVNGQISYLQKYIKSQCLNRGQNYVTRSSQQSN